MTHRPRSAFLCRTFLTAALLLPVLACREQAAAPTPVKLSPTALRADAAPDSAALFDRDTTTGVELARPVTLTLSYAHDVQVSTLKVFARGAVRAELEGAPAFEAEGQEVWESLVSTAAPEQLARRRQVTLRLSPLHGSARVQEIELWGQGLPMAPRSAQVLAERSRETGGLPYENVYSFHARPNVLTLTPRGMGEGPDCGQLRLISPVPGRAVRRAHLVYEANSVQRPVVLRRSLNGAAAQGGFWLAAGKVRRTVADELDPELLTGDDQVTLCLPDAAADVVNIEGLRVLLELDDGHLPLEREALLELGAAADGDARTARPFFAGGIELPLVRPFSFDSAFVDSASPAARLTAGSFDGTQWHDVGPVALGPGRQALELGGALSRGVRLAFEPGPRADVPAASLSEVVLAGSGVGPRIGQARLVITSPPLRAVGGRLIGERFGDRTFVAGWTESPAGRGRVEIDGVPVGSGDGAFGTELQRSTPGVWTVTVRAWFPDGSEVIRTLTFDDERASELDEGGASPGGAIGTDDTRFGAEEQTQWGRIDGAGGKVTLGTEVELEAPEGAVAGPLSIGITRKMPEALPRLDPGMVNVTAPLNAGYRFHPPGQQFARPVKVRIPYDPALLPEGMGPEHIRTYYYDPDGGQWRPLERKLILRAPYRIESETTHFTFMINAVLVMPDHPGPASFDPNSIQDLKAADPSANIGLIAPPEGNNQGSARLTLPIDIPDARGAHTPSLQLAYDSGGGNGWLGVGWDLAFPSVQVDTRFGAPFHDGSERFALDGEQVVPVGTGPCVDGTSGKRYSARVEKGFRRVVHCGQAGGTDRWEVTEKNGTVMIYGASPGARLADASDPSRIGQWNLERVVDANGNLTLYRYAEDKKRLSGGTAFDDHNAEPFRQLYPRQILYTGKVARADAAKAEAAFLSAAELGPYLVELDMERHPDGRLKERPDILLSGKMGFKAATRYRLGAVKVRLNTPESDEIIREYRFTYAPGDFGKSRLVKVAQHGLGGAFFHAHELEYTSADSGGQRSFVEAVKWSFAREDDQAMTASSEWSLGGHAYAGVGFTASKTTGSAGLRVGFNHRESTTHATLLDINGDGLVDRVASNGGQLQVQLNNGPARTMSNVAPPGDPFQGGAIGPIQAPNVKLGAESGNSVNAAVQATFGAFSANVGLTQSWSTSSSFMADADGDGLVDAMGPGGVLFNQLRGPGGCNPSSFCFAPTKPVVGALPFGNLVDSQGAFAADPTVADARQRVEKDFSPTDALLEWTAPYAGTVDVSGTLKWAVVGQAADPARDGVRLRVYREGQLLAEYTKALGDDSDLPVSVTGVQVRPRERLYFVLSTLRTFGVDGTQSPPVPLEKVQFAPTIQYAAEDPTLIDPTGAPLFRFDAAQDFKLSGEPMLAVQVPSTGTLVLSGQYATEGTADEVRLCVQRFPAGDIAKRPCQTGDLLYRGFPSTAHRESMSQTVSVQSGDSLVFRMETDLPIDPESVSWTIGGEMTVVCTGSTCAPPSDEDRARLRFEADPYLPLHHPIEPVPLRPLVIPQDGKLILTSSGTASPSVIFSARALNRLLFKHRAGESRSWSEDVRAGDQLTFQAHSPLTTEGTRWTLGAQLEIRSADGGVERIPLDPPRHHTSEAHPIFRLPQSPFGGGFHGWRYGLWGGRKALGSRPEETFDPSLFTADSDAGFEGDDDRDRFHDAKGKLRDEESEENRRARLYAPLVPRRQGTRFFSTAPGLNPAPAFVSQDGTCFIGEGTMHGGHKGAVASGPTGTGTVEGSLNVGDTSRASATTSFAAGIGASLGPASLSLNVSKGSTEQRMDVRDMNGDGIIDVVVSGQGGANGIRVTHLKQRNLRAEVRTGGDILSKSSDLTATVGMGLSSPVPKVSAGGRIKAMEGMFPTGMSAGAGLAATLSATDLEVTDFNGDGLPDLVRRVGGAFKVRLNLGSRYAAAEDTVPVAGWNVSGPFDPFVSALGMGDGGGDDGEESQGRGDALSLIEKLATPEVVRRSTAVTLEGNFGLTIAEDYGVTANWSSSLNGTQVVLTDITGDGLPDYVRKSSSEDAFRVKVNRGFGFGPEEIWPVPAWPTGVTNPKFKVNPLLQETAVRLLGLEDGIDTVEASGSHSALPSVGFVATIPIPIGPFTPWLHLSAGGDFSPQSVSGFELGLMDVNGDGAPDHVLKTEEQIPVPGMPGNPGRPNRNAVYARLNTLSGGNLLARVKRPLGGTISLAYVRQGNTVDLPESRYVLTEVVVDDGTGDSGAGHTLRTTYAYADGQWDRAERDFYGFGTVTRVNPDGSRAIQTFHNDRFHRKGLLLSEETRDAAGQLFNATLYEYADPAVLAAPLAECMAYAPFFLSAADYCSSSFTPLIRVENRRYEGLTGDRSLYGMRSQERMQYDLATGNVTTFHDDGDLADPGDDLQATMAYADDPPLLAIHRVDLPRQIVVRAGASGGPGAVLRAREGDYDERGNLIRQRQQMDATGRMAESLLTWNGDGMLETVTGPPNARGQRYTVSYSYEPVTRSMVSRTTDSFGYTSLAEYDLRFTEVRRVIDLNGNITARAYDAFGRLSRIWGPYDPEGGQATLAMTYNHSARRPWALTEHKLPDAPGDTLDTVTFVDGLARIIQTKKDAEVAGRGVGTSVTGHLGFDVMGRVTLRGQTFFDAGDKTAYSEGAPVRPMIDTLDLMGRVRTTTTPDGAVTTMSYDFGPSQGSGLPQFRATIVDALGNTRVMYRDIDDAVSATEERLEGRRLTTRYETDPLGQLVRVTDAAGNQTLAAYDLVGRRIAYTTPDTGLAEFRYDDAGNLVERIDPNLRAANQSLKYEYEFNRVVRVDRPVSDDLVFVYGGPGAAENGAGHLVHATDEVGTETRGYGKLGEVVRTTRTVRPLKPGDRPRSFTTRFTHDSFGRMLSVLYPDAEEVRYSYDAGGLLARAVGYRPGSPHAPPETQVYLRALVYDVFGQRVGMELGNGVLSTYTYDLDTRRLATLATRTPRGRTIQALTYSYDKVGNVTGMTNALGQPIGSRSGAVTYTFTYDQLYRLTQATGVALARPGLIDRFKGTFAYSDIHNMLRKTQVHELLSAQAADPHPARPDHSNHDEVYLYEGGRPHQATRIGDRLLRYDLNGNTLIECRTVNGSVCAGMDGSPATHNHYRRYAWTEENTLRSVIHGGGDVTGFLYDHEGERVAKLGRGGISLSIGQFFSVKGKRHGTKHVFAGPARVASKLLPIPDGDIGYEPPYGGDPNAPVESGCEPSTDQPQKCEVVVGLPSGPGQEPFVRPATYYYHPDHLGSTSWVTDQLGRVHEHVEYFPYGDVWRDQRHDDDGGPPKTPRYLFSGKEIDEETGLSYFGARYYDARRARWISPDPFREEWGNNPSPALLSLYAYANNSPLAWRDPTGKVPEWLHTALDVAGLVPVLGEVADGANALIYLSEGRHVEAALSAAAMVPLAGMAATTAKVTYKAGKKLMQEGGERLGKQMVGAVEKKLAKACSGPTCGIPGKDAATSAAKKAGANWKNVKQFGHTFNTHGAGAKNTRNLTGRARGTGTPQGQWLNNQKAADFLSGVKVDGPATVRIPEGLGQVIKPDGSIVRADWARVVPTADGFKTAFPIVP